MVRAFPVEEARGHAAQFVVDEVQQAAPGARAAGVQLFQDLADVADGVGGHLFFSEFGKMAKGFDRNFRM
jgi:hypothetical protein